ncbi:unnamed protein product [Owenia fusiformis]|uniref:Uncharacterized protein n=1 Tax=Owenia fusiformis TaxID=6347 RepID=A0A8J1YAL9_OWEFU|nr:unnamed protein product [Owenia fusiformis]
MMNFSINIASTFFLLSVAFSSMNGLAQFMEVEQEQDVSNCTLTMFQNDTNAYYACLTQYALQQNWFPSPIAGLFTYLDWNGFDGFWQNGAVLETMANFCHYGNNTRYRNVLVSSWRTMEYLLKAYWPLPSYDDEGWFGLAFSRIYEVTGNASFLQISRNVTDYLWTNGWDSTLQCNGGFWFGGGHLSKNTITSVQMLSLTARMYRATKNESYLAWANLTLNYLVKSALNHTTYLVSDGIADTYDCTQRQNYNITYNAGLFIGGLAELYKINKNDSYLVLADKIARATIAYNSKDGVLQEYCDWDNACQHDLDGQMFKGIFVKNLRYLMDVSDNSNREFYSQWLQNNIKSVIKNSICDKRPVSQCNISYLDGPSKNPAEGPIFTENWLGPFDRATPMSQTAVLDLLIANIKDGVTCKGPGCAFNPELPPIVKLHCSDNPCPRHYACCAREKGKFTTCCQPYQTCESDGGCYPP